MNIFVISKNPRECAECLDDLRLNKMIIETAQILSVAARRLFPDIDASGLYKDSHINHPCVKWAYVDKLHFNFLFELFGELAEECYIRTGKSHLSIEKIYQPLLDFYDFTFHADNYKERDFCNCTPYKNLPVFEAYKKTLCEKWDNDKRPPKWTKRGKPEWYGGRNEN